MNFLDAVKTCYKNYAKFKGRASRSEFWYFWLFNYAIYAILIIIALNISFKFFWFLGVFFLVNFIPFIAVAARRLHDVNKSGWFVLIEFIPLIGWIILLVMLIEKGIEGKNRFGDYPLKLKKNK